jgi:two-component system, sensor histidine kinase
MFSFSAWPVRRLLIVGSAAVALTALAVSLAVGLWTAWLRESARVGDELAVSAGLIAEQIAQDAPRGSWLPLDPQVPGVSALAAQALGRLQNDPGVHAARILPPDTPPQPGAPAYGPRTVWAQWTRSSPARIGDRLLTPPGARPDFAKWAVDLIEVRALIERQGLPLGTLVVSGYRPSLWAMAQRDLVWALPAIVVALVFSLWLGLRLAAFIMRPMRQLAGAARAAGREGDYSVRLPLPGDPDLAAVAREFNQMADLVGQRDAMLEARVQERTAALVAARTAADAASAAKSRFLALMSHEIRTPLHGVIGSAELLGQAGLAARELLHVQHIQHSALALQGIVDDVLDLTGLDNERLRLRLTDASPAEIMRKAAAPHASAALAKGLGWQLLLAPACEAQRRVDAQRLAQVVGKLLANAVKFTPRGHVTLEAQIDATQRLLVTVTDTGVGFDLRELPRLLRPFEQAQNSAARRHEGSGLGLAVAQAYSDLMGATLHFDSAPAEGTRARLSLLLPRAAATAVPIPSHIVGIDDGQTNAALGPILVVEDNEVNQFVITAMLERLGAGQVHVASSGAQALRMTKQVAYDLVLMDWQMPEMDGLEVIAHLRAREKAQAARAAASAVELPAARLPIVVLTANAMAGDREQCLEAGADGYLSKPLRLDELRATLTQFPRRAPVQRL